MRPVMPLVPVVPLVLRSLGRNCRFALQKSRVLGGSSSRLSRCQSPSLSYRSFSGSARLRDDDEERQWSTPLAKQLAEAISVYDSL
ncbi:hypothetical protein B0T17DRAFT_91887 [Bombardia bombarda]|uniref:Uncharacterized protein n=1 Tax=Bombardia bombarda TaxID=252184 RepID=A0AA39XNH9_9PEZI|nr:hypothetical protein B0T17DRAFT_91887 [Bombardia bombarda]